MVSESAGGCCESCNIARSLLWCGCQREPLAIYFLGIIWVLVHGSLVLLFALSSFSGIVFLGSIWLTGIIVVGSMRHSGIFWGRWICQPELFSSPHADLDLGWIGSHPYDFPKG